MQRILILIGILVLLTACAQTLPGKPTLEPLPLYVSPIPSVTPSSTVTPATVTLTPGSKLVVTDGQGKYATIVYDGTQGAYQMWRCKTNSPEWSDLCVSAAGDTDTTTFLWEKTVIGYAFTWHIGTVQLVGTWYTIQQ